MAASLPSPVSPSARRHGLILILLTVFAWSVIGLISKNCLAAGVSPLETAFWRAAIGAACFITHATLSRQIRIPLRHAALFTVFGFWAVRGHVVRHQAQRRGHGRGAALYGTGLGRHVLPLSVP